MAAVSTSEKMGSASDIPKLFPEANITDDDACSYAMQLVSFSVLPMTLKAAIELGLLDLLAVAGEGAKLSAEELAVRIGATNPLAPIMIQRILRLLVSYSILTFSVTTDANGRQVHTYGVSPVCKYLTPNEEGISMAALCLMTQDKVNMESWHYVKDAVMNGGVPFNKAHGGLTLFDYHEKDPRISKVFNEAMRSFSITTLSKILEKYTGFHNMSTVIDVGGGTGGTLSMIITKNPHIKGINFDLPHVISQAPALPGVEHIGGDMFENIPSGNAIFMKHILHDWSDEDCLKILKNCWKALSVKGKVVIMDHIIDETPETSCEAQRAYHLDMIMLLESPSGKERTKKEFEDLAMRSGFFEYTAVLSFAKIWIMEFTK